MRTVIDANIPLGREFFSSIGDVLPVPPRDICRQHLLGADALVVRSVKHIDGDMVRGTPVKFVGTCTAGFDHLDTEALSAMGIAWRNAPGCNAKAVVEYVFSVFSALNISWSQSTVGIVGCGHVGGLLYRTLKQLGVECRCFDPFVSASHIPDLTDLDRVMASDIICLHTPLSHSGPHPTFHLLNQARLEQIATGGLLINAGRGPVVDNEALLRVLQQRQDLRCVLDVWEHEPTIPLALAERLSIATPHIAGHSVDGKIRGTAQIYTALCEHMGETPSLCLEQLVGQAELPLIQSGPGSDEQSIAQAILAAYDVRRDHKKLMESMRAGESSQVYFDLARKQYPERREFSNYLVAGSACDSAISEALKTLEFQIESGPV